MTWAVKLRNKIPSQKLRIQFTSYFRRLRSLLAPGSLEQEQSFPVRSPVHSRISPCHMPRGLCGSLEWQTIVSTCLFCSFTWPLVWVEMHNPGFLALGVLTHVSVASYCSEFRRLSPKLHIHIFNWAEAILTPPSLPLSPTPYTQSLCLWLWSQGEELFRLLTPFLLFSSQSALFLSLK